MIPRSGLFCVQPPDARKLAFKTCASRKITRLFTYRLLGHKLFPWLLAID
jgi:hypothetical protein